MGNPFTDCTDDLLVLDTRDIVDEHVVETVKHIERIGKEQYESFVEERLETRTKPLADPIKQNKFPLFSRPPIRSESKTKQQLSSLKENCSLFAQLYISCQVRKGDLDDFFSHENNTYPPAISQFGNLRFGNKADLTQCLENITPSATEKPDVDVFIIDGAAVVNMLKPIGCSTFHDYFINIFQPYIERNLALVKRIDIVWDQYFPESLKATTRLKRGKGVRRRVEPDSRVPGNWDSFLRLNENKQELFCYLAEATCQADFAGNKLVVSTKNDTVITNQNTENTSSLSPCSHEEADTRLILHAADAARKGFKKIALRTVDTDVVIIAVAHFSIIGVDELWITFGVGKYLRYIPVHTIADKLGREKCKALPILHAFTGCDQTSAFNGKGKETAWQTWEMFDEVTEAFNRICIIPSKELILEVMPTIERFVVLMYDRSSNATGVNEARKLLFTRKGRSIDGIPPTSDALYQHTKRVALQAGYCWGQALVLQPEMPSPSEWGWEKTQVGSWTPYWSSIPPASQSCQELLKCGCKVDKGCRGRCKCVKADMPCTALCQCGGNCDRDVD